MAGPHLSLSKELAMAEEYAQEAADWPKSKMESCLENAIAIATREGKDISAQVAKVRQIWDKNIAINSKK